MPPLCQLCFLKKVTPTQATPPPDGKAMLNAPPTGAAPPVQASGEPAAATGSGPEVCTIPSLQ